MDSNELARSKWRKLYDYFRLNRINEAYFLGNMQTYAGIFARIVYFRTRLNFEALNSCTNVHQRVITNCCAIKCGYFVRLWLCVRLSWCFPYVIQFRICLHHNNEEEKNHVHFQFCYSMRHSTHLLHLLHLYDSPINVWIVFHFMHIYKYAHSGWFSWKFPICNISPKMQ